MLFGSEGMTDRSLSSSGFLLYSIWARLKIKYRDYININFLPKRERRVGVPFTVIHFFRIDGGMSVVL